MRLDCTVCCAWKTECSSCTLPFLVPPSACSVVALTWKQKSKGTFFWEVRWRASFKLCQQLVSQMNNIPNILLQITLARDKTSEWILHAGHMKVLSCMLQTVTKIHLVMNVCCFFSLSCFLLCKWQVSHSMSLYANYTWYIQKGFV